MDTMHCSTIILPVFYPNYTGSPPSPYKKVNLGNWSKQFLYIRDAFFGSGGGRAKYGVSSWLLKAMGGLGRGSWLLKAMGLLTEVAGH